MPDGGKEDNGAGAADTAAEKPSRRAARDPAATKAKDNQRQRKIASNASDKAARRNAPLIKARANRGARRAAKVPLTEAESDIVEENAQVAVIHHRTKRKTWGSGNAAAHRARRKEERALLDATAALPDMPKGRRRTTMVRNALDVKPVTGKP